MRCSGASGRGPGRRCSGGGIRQDEVVALLVSHSHYSIDIVGGLLLGYFVYYEYYRGRVFARLRPLLEV